MGHGQTKRLRKLIRRATRAQIGEHDAFFLDNALRPKPWFIPWRIWWLLRLIVMTRHYADLQPTTDE